MLVSEKKAAEWYQRDNPMYLRFALLFSNKLWDMRVPQGFAICPYYWAAQFSRFIFQPFIYYPLLLVLTMLKLLCVPFRFADGFCTNVMERLGVPAPLSKAGVLAPVALAFVGFVLFCVSVIWYQAACFAAQLPGLCVSFWASHALIAYILFRGYMEIEHPCGFCDENGWVLSLLFLGILIVATTILVPGTWALVGLVASASVLFLLNGVLWCLNMVFVKGLWVSLKWVGTALFSIWPILLTFGLAALALGLLGYFADRLFPEARKKVATVKPKIDYRYQWESYFIKLFNYWNSHTLEQFYERPEFDDYRGPDGFVVASMRNYVSRSILTDICASELDAMRYDKPPLPLIDKRGEPCSYWDLEAHTIPHSSIGLSIRSIREKLYNFDLRKYVPKSYTEDSKLDKAFDRLDKFFGMLDYVFSKTADPLMDKFLKEKRDLEKERIKAEKSAERWALLHNKLHAIMEPIANGFAKLFGLLGRFCSELWHQVCLGFKLLKKGKKGICPYFPFTDAPNEKAVDFTDDSKIEPKG